MLFYLQFTLHYANQYTCTNTHKRWPLYLGIAVSDLSAVDEVGSPDDLAEVGVPVGLDADLALVATVEDPDSPRRL